MFIFLLLYLLWLRITTLVTTYRTSLTSPWHLSVGDPALFFITRYTQSGDWWLCIGNRIFMFTSNWRHWLYIGCISMWFTLNVLCTTTSAPVARSLHFNHYLTRVTWRVTSLQKFPTNTGQRCVKTDYNTLKITSKTFQENYDMHRNTNTCTYSDTVLYIHTTF